MIIVVCNACGEPWQGPGNPAVCPKCGVASFGIAIERSAASKSDNKDEIETGKGDFVPTSTGGGAKEMTIEEKVRDILEQYRADEVMLDAFFQWANSQFRRKGEGKHAWAQEKAYGYFLNNLRLRYGLSATDAEGIGRRLEEECKALSEDNNEFELKKAIIAALSGPTGDTLRKNVQLKVDKASASARGLLAVYNWLRGFPEYQGAMSSTAWAGSLEALYRVTFGTLPGSEVKSFAAARDELISCGVINKSFYESGTGKTSYDEYLPGILVPQVDLSFIAPAVDGNSISTYVQALFTGQAFEQARILEEVALHGVTTYDVYGKGELPGEVIPHRGLFVYVDTGRGKVAAVNPLSREVLLKNMLELKMERLKSPASAIETALDRFRDQVWPESDLTRLSDEPDRRVWRLDQIDTPRLFIFISNWLSEPDLTTIRNLGAQPLQDAFMFALANQSLPSIKKVIAHSLKMWEKASITVITPTPKGMASHQLQGLAHPSLSRILELLGVEPPPPPPTKCRVEVKVTDNAGAALSNGQVNIGVMSANTLDDGRAVLEVSAGTYVLTVIAKGYDTFKETITITKDEQKSVQLRRVSEEEFSVVVFVKDQALQPVDGVLVNFGPSVTVTTGPDGTAAVNVASGNYDVRLSKAGYNTVSEKVEVTHDAAKEFILSPRPEGPSQDFILVGEEQVSKQWGTIGKSGERRVLFDLNAPHVVFVCGKMGYGKGYTIGALTEMLVAEPIPGLCDVTKKATVIVFYKPRENVPSEFYSITKPNDVASEVSRLRSEYQVEPKQLVAADKFKVFVDPGVYQRAAKKFQKEYDTEGVLPLHVDPSSLTGDEWGIVLSAGERTEQQYVKRLFAILEKLQSETFDLQRVRAEVRSDPRLNNQQKNLAEARLDILSNYIKKGQEQDFVDKLALGGVNIFDFRQTIRTPDDVFSVMTLVISVLQTKKGLASEPFVFVLNEAHDYFRGGVAADFVDSMDRLIRRKRHGANWLLLDTHFPDDVDDTIIKLADVKVMHYMDKIVDSPLLRRGFGSAAQQFSQLHVGEAFILADRTSLGLSQVVKVEVRPRITKHGAPTKLAI